MQSVWSNQSVKSIKRFLVAWVAELLLFPSKIVTWCPASSQEKTSWTQVCLEEMTNCGQWLRYDTIEEFNVDSQAEYWAF